MNIKSLNPYNFSNLLNQNLYKLQSLQVLKVDCMMAFHDVNGSFFLLLIVAGLGFEL